MKIKSLFILFLTILILSKGVFFVITLKLSDEIRILDKKIKQIQEENIQLEKEVSFLSSYRLISSSAAELGFIKNNKLVFLENLPFAQK